MEKGLTNLTTHPIGIFILIISIIGYALLILERKTKLYKEKVVLFVGTLSFILLAATYKFSGLNFEAFNNEFMHTIERIVEIYFFLMVAMSFVEILIEMNLFRSLQHKIISMNNITYRKIFWVINTMCFFVSSLADNLTSVIIGAAILKQITKDKRIIIPCAIAIVVSSNAGGVWSPFGDITTLIIWSYHKVKIYEFLYILPSAALGWWVTLYLISKKLPNDKVEIDLTKDKDFEVKKGAWMYVFIGISTIVMVAVFRSLFELPPFWSMLFGLSIASFWSYFTNVFYGNDEQITKHIAVIDHDTLLYFFGIIAVVSSLGVVGYLSQIVTLYNNYPAAIINFIMGLISAVIDNASLVTAVMKSNPHMSLSMWLLLSLTTGIGGSIISFGSAAGVGLMGVFKGIYTLKEHLHYAPIILLGYLISVGALLLQITIL